MRRRDASPALMPPRRNWRSREIWRTLTVSVPSSTGLVVPGHCNVYINVTMRRSRVGWTQRRAVPGSVVLRAKIFIGPCAPKVVRKKVVRKGGQKTTVRSAKLQVPCVSRSGTDAACPTPCASALGIVLRSLDTPSREPRKRVPSGAETTPSGRAAEAYLRKGRGNILCRDGQGSKLFDTAH